LGLVGAYVTPLAVATNRPNYWALYVYLMVVTAAAFALARARLWRWLALTAVGFGVLWTLPGLPGYRVHWVATPNFRVGPGVVLVAIFIVSGLLFGPEAVPGKIEPVSSLSLAAYLIASTVLVLGSGHDGLAMATYVVLVGATIAIAWQTEAAAAAVPAAALLTLIVFVDWALSFNVFSLIAPSGVTAPAIPDPSRV